MNFQVSQLADLLNEYMCFFLLKGGGAGGGGRGEVNNLVNSKWVNKFFKISFSITIAQKNGHYIRQFSLHQSFTRIYSRAFLFCFVSTYLWRQNTEIVSLNCPDNCP